MNLLFESSSCARKIYKQTRKGLFREFWSIDLKSSLLNLISSQLRESTESDQLLSTVQEKLSKFLLEIKQRLASLDATYDEKRQFYSHLTNTMFKTLGVSIEGAKLKAPINKVRTSFPQTYESGNAKQSALIRRNYERLKAMFQNQGHENPHQAAIESIKRDWHGLNTNLLNSLGKEPKISIPKVKSSVSISTTEEPEENGKFVLGKKKMTREEIVADARNFLSTQHIGAKRQQRIALRKFLGNEHYHLGKSKNRDQLISSIVDEILGEDRLKDKNEIERDETKAKQYLTSHKWNLYTKTGTKEPSANKIDKEIQDQVQKSIYPGRDYVRIFISKDEHDADGRLALIRSKLREMGYTVLNTEKEEDLKIPQSVYKIFMEKK